MSRARISLDFMGRPYSPPLVLRSEVHLVVSSLARSGHGKETTIWIQEQRCAARTDTNEVNSC